MRPCLLVFIVLVTLVASIGQASARPSAPRLSRIRAMDDGISRVLEDALSRSATVRRIVAEIETGDVLVFVSFEHEMRRTAGRMKFVGVSKRHRMVHIAVRRDLAPNDAIAILGHELEHAREVVTHPDVRDAETLNALYRRIGHEREIAGRRAVDTVGARRAGDAVRREIR